MKVGILALQGAVQPHEEKFKELQIDTLQVRTSKDLKACDAIVLPGGESSTMIKLLKLNQLWDDLKVFTKSKPAWGICAGAILLANRVENPAQESLHVIDLTAERNAYGRQLDSFITTELTLHEGLKDAAGQEAVFIRAPRLKDLGSSVKILISHKDEAVMVRSNNALACCFHPELSAGKKLHKYFADLVAQSL